MTPPPPRANLKLDNPGLICDRVNAAENGKIRLRVPATFGQGIRDEGTRSAFDDTSETFKDLVPGTYDCKVVGDP
jgi:hypothetical protein